MKRPEPVIVIISLLLVGAIIQFQFASEIARAFGDSEVTVKIHAPAVARSEEGLEGVITEILLTVSRGTGEIYISTTPLTEIDMQASARMAVLIGSQLVGEDFHRYNFYFKVNSPSPLVGGPSAGAEMTIAVVSALKGLKINASVMMTGMINPDGTIGPVGGIPEKMEAAAAWGIKMFLIPLGQRFYTKYEVIREKIGPFIIRKPVSKVIDLMDYGRRLGVEVVEVGDVREAIAYFTGENISVRVPAQAPMLDAKLSKELKRRFEELVREAEKIREEALNLTESLREESEKGLLNDAIKKLDDAIMTSKALYSRRMYYSAMSVVFGALIRVQYANYIARIALGDDLDDIAEEVEEIVNKIDSSLRDVKFEGVISLQFLIAAKFRVKDAKMALDKASYYYQGGDYQKALEELAYAKWRAKSALFWTGLIGATPDTPISTSSVEQLTNDYIYEAETTTMYVRTILSEMGYSSQYVDEAEAYLREAKRDYSSNETILALAEAVHALVYVSNAVILPLADERTLSYQLNYSRGKALEALWSCINSSISPMLGLLYFEYAEFLNQTEAKLLMYRLSSTYSITMLLLGRETKGGESGRATIPESPRVITITETETVTVTSTQTVSPPGIRETRVLSLIDYVLPALIAFFIGLAAGHRIRRSPSKGVTK